MSQYEPPAYQPPQPYKPPRPYQPPPPSSNPYPSQQVQHVIHHYQPAPRSAGTAVLLEVLPGFFLQTFGIGHIYAGNVGVGLLFMFGYWFVLFVNILLCLLIIGFITGPLCFLGTMLVSSMLAANAVTRNNAAGYR